jgi:Ecdysteroid kinase-like family
MIDLQLVRLSPASIDLQFFLYLGTDKPFRDAHEQSLLSAYVEEFNAHLRHAECRLTLAEITKEYDACRLFGAILAATIRPACFLEGWVAENDGEINQQVVSTFIDGLPVQTLMQSFQKDQYFRQAVVLLVEELLEQLKIFGI